MFYDQKPVYNRFSLSPVRLVLCDTASVYAYGEGEGPVTIRVETLPEERAVCVTFIDAGQPFDPLAAPEPDVTLPRSQRRIGGLGILMVKKMMDEVSYEYAGGQNILRIRKNF